MKITGLITEYNPFHNGHAYHLAQAKALTAADCTVAVMSGHFLQRGEPAIVDKWTRAEMAVRCGVDLVVELPTYFATASAEQFAYGAVNLLSRLGVDNICFGSESGDIKQLSKVAGVLAMPDADFAEQLRRHLDAGAGYHKAIELALSNTEVNGFTFSANNILAIEYLKAALKINNAPKMVTLKRCGSAYNDSEMQGHFSSASAIRRQLERPLIDWQLVESAMPADSFRLLYNSHFYVSLNDLKALIYTVLLHLGKVQLASIRGFSEGLENRLLDHLSNIGSVTDLVDAASSKRYPKTRIQRLLINSLLGIRQIDCEQIDEQADYARILAFNDMGRKAIKHFKKHSDLVLFTNLGRDLKKYRRPNRLIELDVKATSIYAQVNRAVQIRADYLHQPVDLSKNHSNN